MNDTPTNPEPFAPLSTRAMNILFNAGYSTNDREKLRNDIVSGRVKLAKLRNCGRLSTRQIYRWAGLSPNSKFCPHCGKAISA